MAIKSADIIQHRTSKRLDMKLSVSASAALTRRLCPEEQASRALVANSIVARYADLMAQYHSGIETKFTAAEISALRSIISKGKYLSLRTLWLQDRATSKMDFVRAVRRASEDPDWSLSRSYTNKLLKVLETVLSTEEYFGLIDYLALDPALQKIF